jgi:hypothetical protein
MNKSCKEKRGGSPVRGFEVGLTTLTVKAIHVTKDSCERWTWANFLVKRSKQQIMDIILVSWNVRIMYRKESLMTVSTKLSGYRLDLLGVQ